MTREERTEGFFVALCTRFIEALLFALFDDDTVDLHSGGIGIIRVAWWDGHQYIQPLYDLTKDTVLVIQVRRGNMRNEKLRTVGVRSCVGHR